YLSIILNPLGRLSGAGILPVYDAIADLLKAVIAKKADPSTLPGLEAMMPHSPTVQFVNDRTRSLGAELVVIAGDMEGAGVLQRLKVIAADLFYRHDNDLVVDTISMEGGAPRSSAWRFVHRAPEVDHFSYFRNAPTVEQLARALDGQLSEAAGFEALRTDQTLLAVRGSRAASTDPHRPIVFLLPGIMGSNLKQASDCIWVDLRDIALGKLERLRRDTAGVSTDGVVTKYYGALRDELLATHEVVTFDYDWRISIVTEARRLAAAIKAKLAATDSSRPIRILAHSMGGLVARALSVVEPDVWAALCQRQGARLVMLGTPNGGSFAPIATLSGSDGLIRKLALLDQRHTVADLVTIVREFEGLLEMLPPATGADYYDPATWSSLLAQIGITGIGPELAPERDALLNARRFRTEVLDRASIDPERMCYVAGKAAGTIEDIEIDPSAPEGERVKFRLTGAGDGRVLWRTGIPEGLKNVWYVDAAHGDLSLDERSFAGYVELLQTGDTSRLSRERPAVDRGVVLRSARKLVPEPIYPSADDIVDTALGGSGAVARPAMASAQQVVNVSVIHGDLQYTDAPVVVGHYDGDDIVSAERVLDRQLGSRLRHRRDLGLYPGRIGTVQVFFNASSRPDGAVVIGLGTPGDLTPGKLTDSVARGLIELSAAMVEEIRAGRRASPAGGLRVGTLVVGSGAGGLPIKDSVYSILRAVDSANQTIAKANRVKTNDIQSAPLVGALDFLELYEDTAHLVFRSVRTHAQSTGYGASRFILTPDELQAGEGGLRRIYNAETREDWWRRLQVTSD
ncbi:MAG: hypothetical protein ABIU95_08505, partial [Burkholderiales bacterium]